MCWIPLLYLTQRPIRMECGDEMAMSVREIKQEVLEEDPDTLEEGGYQVIYVKEEIEDEDSRQDGGEAEMQMTTESSTESVGNPSLRNSNWDSGWQLPEEDEEEDVSEVGNADAPFQYRIQDSNRQLSGDTEEQDDRGATNPKLRISGCGKRSHQGTAGRDKGKVLKTSTKTGTRVGNPILQVTKEGVSSHQVLSGHDKEKDNKTSTKQETQGNILSKGSSTVLVLSSRLKLNAKFWTRADVSQRDCSSYTDNSANYHKLNQGVYPQRELNKKECKINSTSSYSKLGQTNGREQTDSNVPVLQSFHCRPNRDNLSIPKSDSSICSRTHTIENPNTSSDSLRSQTTEEKPYYQCSVCSKRFQFKWERIEHVMTAHSREKRYKCPHCYKGFDLEDTLKDHVNKDHVQVGHVGDKRFQCSVCDRISSSKYNLKMHMTTHTGEKPYPCSECNKRFSRKNFLSEHMKIHTGDRPHQCWSCSRSFTRHSHLASHILSHLGLSPYRCSVCNKGLINCKGHDSNGTIIVKPSD